ncbi:MAG: hypothetical protein RXR11_03175 [Caldivirga sp.]
MAYHVRLIDCLRRCEDYYAAGSSARARCYEVCVDQFGRVIEAMFQGKLMSIKDYETMVKFKNYCAGLVKSVNNLSKHCEEYYSNVTVKSSASEAKGEVAEGQFTDELADCIRDCVRYYGDNAPELNRCYSMCRAIWGNTGVKWSCGEFKSCFPGGCFELEEFKREFRRIGKSGFEGWQIVSKVGSIIGTMLREGRERGCRDLEDNIIKLMITELEDLGIDRYSIRKAYLHGLSSEVKDILMKIFPNVTQISKDNESEATSPIARLEPPVKLILGPKTPTPKYRAEPVKPQARKSRSKAIGAIIVMAFFVLIIYAALHSSQPNGGNSNVLYTIYTLPPVNQYAIASNSTSRLPTTSTMIYITPSTTTSTSMIAVYSGSLSLNAYTNECMVINVPQSQSGNWSLSIVATSNMLVTLYVFGPFRNLAGMDCNTLTSNYVIYGSTGATFNFNVVLTPNTRYYIVIYNNNQQDATVSINAELIKN